MKKFIFIAAVILIGVCYYRYKKNKCNVDQSIKLSKPEEDTTKPVSQGWDDLAGLDNTSSITPINDMSSDSQDNTQITVIAALDDVDDDIDDDSEEENDD